MALSVCMHGSRRLPVLSNVVSKLMTIQQKNSQLLITPIVAKQFSAFNRQVQEAKKYNNAVITQTQHRMFSHSLIWTAEKVLSAALLGLIPTCFIVGGQTCDNILAVAVAVHMHWGTEAVIVDYIRPSLVGNTVAMLARLVVFAISIFTMAGLLYFNYNDIGITRAVKQLWAIKGGPRPCEAPEEKRK